MQRGYAYVMVDLRGFGGSNGCLDWVGPGEQADVKAAVQWAASQPWSTGSVGMYGKSYDGVTGLVGEATQPAGLRAIVSQEPVYDLYRYLYTNGVRYENSLATPALYDAIAATPGTLTDSPTYNGDAINDLARPGCPVPNYLDQALNSDHRGDNKAPQPWFDQVMRFYDQYVRGIPPTVQDPPVSVETSDGSWRSEPQWPPADARPYTSHLRSGAYMDTALNAGSSEGALPLINTTGKGVWTISPPLANDAHLAGVPAVTLNVSSLLPNANLSVDLYDIDAKNSALLLSRNAYLLPSGNSQISPEMYGNDWLIPAGHRLGVLVTTANAEWWTPLPSLSNVTVNSGSITLPFLTYTRPDHIPGKRPARLDAWLSAAPFTVDGATIAKSTSPGFALPPPQTPHP
jgi:predicted acyl esterase